MTQEGLDMSSLQEKSQAEGKIKGTGSQQDRLPSQAARRPNTPAAGPAQAVQSQSAGKVAAKAPKAGRASSRKGQTSEMFAHLPQYKV